MTLKSITPRQIKLTINGKTRIIRKISVDGNIYYAVYRGCRISITRLSYGWILTVIGRDGSYIVDAMREKIHTQDDLLEEAVGNILMCYS